MNIVEKGTSDNYLSVSESRCHGDFSHAQLAHACSMGAPLTQQ